MYYLAHVVIVMVLQPDRIWKVGIASAAYTSIHDCHHKFMFVMYTYPMNMMSGADSGGGGLWGYNPQIIFSILTTEHVFKMIIISNDIDIQDNWLNDTQPPLLRIPPCMSIHSTLTPHTQQVALKSMSYRLSSWYPTIPRLRT